MEKPAPVVTVFSVDLQIESQTPQDPTKLKEIQFDLEDIPASLLQ